ncbi:hypothetical protein EVC45_43835 [Paraburkholderia sp. UYCP14C]|uniref:hypothetical protein n=1 Tax=Paraburkholderia sp. UYCP14C TaxID=2511130 RepID=UPI001020AC64|nr:hypothetical protein [Paraburkholderia sp. UYCP14C]RZF23555.1 hypothetical protein EVC45_43835 [Paraburkholderia sp. UYCP14C]
MKKSKLIFFLFSSLSAGTALAGEYTETGYITEVKANIQGSVCDIMLSDISSGKNIQGGRWRCDSYMGQNLLDVAKTANALKLRVNVTFEGNGAQYKPVYSIHIINQ